MDGKSFFYTNAMEIRNTYSHTDMEAERSGWFTCSCCPTNVTRLIPSVPGYVYAQKGNDIYVNLFVSGKATVAVNAKKIEIVQTNNYPWDGQLKFSINPTSSAEFNLLVRIPGWADNQAMPSDLYSFQSASTQKVSISVNGKPIDTKLIHGYAVISRKWKKGDVVQVDLPMEVRRVVANHAVKDDIGKVSLQRGPLIFCAEWPDNQGKTSNLILPPASTFSTEFKPDLLNGIMVLKSEARAVVLPSAHEVTTAPQPFIAIPYYAWAHRGKGEMTVWFPEKVTNVDLISK
jgi:hypothetical protein